MKYKVLDIHLLYLACVIFALAGFILALITLTLAGQLVIPSNILVLNTIACLTCFVVGTVIINVNVVKVKDEP